MIMHCMNCGREIFPWWKYCPVCGFEKPIGQLSEEETQEGPQETPLIRIQAGNFKVDLGMDAINAVLEWGIRKWLK